MRLKLKDTPEQIQLIQAMGSKNMTTAHEAQEAFAKFMGPVIQILLMKAGTASQIYTDAPYNADTDNPSYPLDLYYDQGAGFIQVWTQSVAGGLPSSETWGLQEMKIATYDLTSAVSFNKRYARKARLDVVAKSVERMANEVLIKQELNAWAVIVKALAEANSPVLSRNGTGIFGSFINTNNKHVIPSANSGVFMLSDLNYVMNLIQRINSSYDGGTPVAPYSDGITDLYLSPEIMTQIRSMAYNPVFTTSALTTPSTVNQQLQLPPSVREELYKSAGTNNFFGINLVQMNEFGVGRKYNTLFETFSVGQNVPSNTGTSTWAAGSGASYQVLVGIDNRRGAFIRPVAKDSDTGSTFVSEVDDQYNIKRVDKAGFYGALNEGRVCIDARSLVGLSV